MGVTPSPERVRYYFAPSGLGRGICSVVNPGRWLGLCYFAPLGLENSAAQRGPPRLLRSLV